MGLRNGLGIRKYNILQVNHSRRLVLIWMRASSATVQNPISKVRRNRKPLVSLEFRGSESKFFFHGLPRGHHRTVFLIGLANKVRASQKTINISGRIPRTKSTCVLVSTSGNSCGRARKMDAEAINSAKQMRQRCRATRCEPRRPPRSSMRASPMAASNATALGTT